jgi:hypothetical protein
MFVSHLLGLVTLALVGAFTLLYLSSALAGKAPFLEKTLTFIRAHLNNLALGGVIYGFIAFCIAPIMIWLPLDMFVRMAANLLLVVMALPFAFDRLLGSHEAKINSAIMKEVRNGISLISRNEKYIGIAGAIIAILLFATLFR